MDIMKLRAVITQNMSLDPSDDFGAEKCWREMTDILADDISASILYFERDCTDEEFYWLGSVFEDVIERTQCKELISVLRKRLAAVSSETYRQNNFISAHMQKWVDYPTYIRSLNTDIEHAEAMLID